jgi:uncharacterized repeat protein (TIGR02543 family)
MSNQVVVNSVLTALNNNSFQRTGYSFLGWSTNSAATSATYTNGQQVTFTSNQNLFAIWQANTLTVTYNSNGGSAVSNGTTTTDTTLASAPTPPTRTGYTFAGWFAASDLSGTQITFPYTHGQTASFTLHAKWTANTLTVTISPQYKSPTNGAPSLASSLIVGRATVSSTF